MTDNNIQVQINDINRKLDLLLEESKNSQAQREEINDLVSDVSIIGKDIFTNTVIELDKAGVELDGAALQNLMIGLVRNVGTFNEMIGMLESGYDLMKDMTPIVNQVGFDAIAKIGEFEKKGYLDFFNEFINITDNIVEHFKVEDVRALADNVVSMLEMIKSMTQPDMLAAMNNALTVYKNMDTENIPEYSMWKAFRTMNSPEMKRGLGFMITFMKNLTETIENKQEK